MKVDVALSVSYIKQEEMHKKTVVVIDTLRATSTILTALVQGAKKVIPVETVGQALNYYGDENTILIGERQCLKVNGFDHGNSPQEIRKLDLTNKTVIITTTNGTKALQKSRKAAHILIGSFMNAQSCVQQALTLKKDLLFVCAGRRGEFAIEDGLAAGVMIKHALDQHEDIELSDTALLLAQYFCVDLGWRDQLTQLVPRGTTGRRLIKTNQREDLEFCLQHDCYPFAGIYEEGGIVPIGNRD